MHRLILATLCLMPFFLFGSEGPGLIGGRPANPGEFPEEVYISIGNSRCSATLIGPRTLLTAAHCGSTGQTAEFQIGQAIYRAKLTRSPLYSRDDHDLSLGYVDRFVDGVKFGNIAGEVVEGMSVTLVGYGCVNPGGGGGNDGILRVGTSTVVGFSNYDMVTRSPSGAALCYGDSGGGAFHIVGNLHNVIGVNSKGNIRDTSYITRTDVQDSIDFFKKWATDNNAQVCGINYECGDIDPEPSPTPEPTPSPEPGSCKEQFLALGDCLGFL